MYILKMYKNIFARNVIHFIHKCLLFGLHCLFYFLMYFAVVKTYFLIFIELLSIFHFSMDLFLNLKQHFFFLFEKCHIENEHYYFRNYKVSKRFDF